MGEKIDIAGLGELEDGTMKSVSVQGRDILLARVDGTVYAIGNVCPHMKAHLSEGTLDGYTVTCPRHGSQFDIRTGENTRWMKGSGVVAAVSKAVKPDRSVPVYRTEVSDNRIIAAIE